MGIRNICLQQNYKKNIPLISLLSGAMLSSYKPVKIPKTAKMGIFVKVLKPQEGLWPSLIHVF